MAHRITKEHILKQSEGTRDFPSDLERSEITLKPRTSVVSKMCSFGLRVFVRFLRNRYRQLRSSVDYGVALIGLMFASPLFIIVGLITKIFSPGPVFYTQARVGKDGRIFNIIKDCSIVINS